MTPHINAKKGEIAKFVLMPGDPLRAKYIADHFLKNVKQVNSVRNMLMFTGEFKGKKVSICGSGMGQPSISIYSYELFKFYDVESIIRIGSAGSYIKELNLYDIVLATEAYTDSDLLSQLILGKKAHVFKSSNVLNEKLILSAQNQNIEMNKSRVHASDVFYGSRSLEEVIKDTNSSCVEMESAALFMNAKKLRKQATTLLTISNSFITNEETTSLERETTFLNMVKIALGIL